MSRTEPGSHECPTVRQGEAPVAPNTTVFGGSPAPPSPASPASRYRPVEVHARGGLGEVCRAYDEELHREVALKRIQQKFAQDPDSQRRFLTEAEVTARLEHPGVVPVHGLVCDENGQPCYAMRFIQGQSLRDAIADFHAADTPARDPHERRLTLQRLLSRFVAVCNTVAYAHARGVIHRDVKPANIMLGKYGETLLVDWGLAKKVDAADPSSGEPSLTPSTTPSPAGGTQLGQAAGTPGYMSPEQANGRWDVVGPASDVFSLGATLYHLLAGNAPIVDRDLARTLARAQRGDFPPPRQVNPHVPRALEAVCLKAMALRPEDRYSSALDLAADLERWLADEPVSAWGEPALTRLRRWVGRHRTLVTAVASTLLVAVVCLGVAMGLLVAANRRADDARRRAEDNEALALRKREEARRSLRLALGVIDRFSQQVGSDPRLRDRDLEELRKDMLQSAIASCRTLLEGEKDDPDLQAALARVQGQLGHLYWQMGEQVRAIAHYREALTQIEPLRHAHPDEAEYRREQGQLLCNLGASFTDSGQPAAAERTFRQALAIQEPQAARPDATARDRDALARTRMNLAVALKNGKGPAQAEKLLRQALRTWAELSSQFPGQRAYQKSLGVCALGLGTLEDRLGRATDAKVSMETARSIFSALVKNDPGSPDLRYHLATALYNLGQLSDPVVGLTHLREARQMLEELARRSPGMAPYQERLAQTCHQLGQRQVRRNELRDAEACFRLMLEAADRLVQRYPGRSTYEEHRAQAYANLGTTLRYTGRFADSEKAFLASLAAYERLGQRDPKDLHSRFNLGWSHNNLGLLYRHMGRRTEAARHHRQALAVRAGLVKEKASAQYRANLASSCTNLANLCPGPVQPNEAERLYLRSIALQKVVVKEEPEQDQHALDWAMSYNNLGLLYLDQDRPGEAATAWEEALKIREDLLRRRPGVPAYLSELVMSHSNLAMLHQKQNEPKQAEASHRQAAEHGRKLARAQLQNAEHVTRGAEAYLGLASWLESTGRWREEATAADTGLRILAAWDTRPLTVLPPRIRQVLYGLHVKKATGLSQLNAYPQALPHWERTVALAEGEYRDLARINRARMLALAGEHIGASDEAVALAALPARSHQVLFALAGTHALAAGTAAQDTRLGPERRNETADLYARRAVGLLREIHRAGAFKTAKARRQLRELPELETLRKRDDFQKLLQDVEGKKEEGRSE
jgi:serine/threonine-protein kinase